MQIIDNADYDTAKRAVEDGEWLLIVDRQLAVQAYKNSGELATHLATLWFVSLLAILPLLWYWWPGAILAAATCYLAIKMLRRRAIVWVREVAFASAGLFTALSSHRVIWFAWP